MNTKENKNPLWAGLVNVLLPGSSQLYVNKDLTRFVGALFINVVALIAAVWFANLIQESRGYSLPQGLCMGALVTIVIAAFFTGGYNTARIRNNEINAAAFYNSKRHVSHESKTVQNAEIQKMREEGLISDLEYQEKKALIDRTNKKDFRIKPPQP